MIEDHSEVSGPENGHDDKAKESGSSCTSDSPQTSPKKVAANGLSAEQLKENGVSQSLITAAQSTSESPINTSDVNIKSRGKTKAKSTRGDSTDALLSDEETSAPAVQEIIPTD